MSGDEKGGLQWAIQNGDIARVNELLKQGADVNEVTNSRTPLHFAADYGQCEVIKILLEKGADINAPDKYDITPLLAAIFEEHTECVELLIKEGASTNGKTPDGQSYYEAATTDSIKAILKGAS
ncbi:myotrophin-like [Argopecten irradians]|uniref:myotrophin-like n=1 Tax=Argopecten irradians TaxID=31199 RepID=UPI00372017DB